MVAALAAALVAVEVMGQLVEAVVLVEGLQVEFLDHPKGLHFIEIQQLHLFSKPILQGIQLLSQMTLLLKTAERLL